MLSALGGAIANGGRSHCSSDYEVKLGWVDSYDVDSTRTSAFAPTLLITPNKQRGKDDKAGREVGEGEERETETVN